MGDQWPGVEVALQEHFGFPGERPEISSLGSYEDWNLLVQAGGSSFVLKCVPAAQADQEHIESECEAAARLAAAGVPCPAPLSSKSGSRVVCAVVRGEPCLLRLLPFADGKPLEDVGVTPAVCSLLGTLAARCDGALEGMKAGDALRRPATWHPSHSLQVVEAHLPHVREAADGREDLIRAAVSLYQRLVVPRLADLPHSVIHNDLNPCNVLVVPPRAAAAGGAAEEQGVEGAAAPAAAAAGAMGCAAAGEESDAHAAPRLVVSAVLDFGDMAWAPTVANLAVAATYMALCEPTARGAVDAIACVASAYAQTRPLTDAELEVLFPMVLARLALSVSVGSRAMAEQPDNAYLPIHRARAWRCLELLVEFPAPSAALRLKWACLPSFGSRLAAARKALESALATCPPHPISPGLDLRAEGVVTLDLTAANPAIASVDVTDARAFTAYVEATCRAAAGDGALVALGRYDEDRVVYQSDLFLRTPFPRSVHLGIDVFLAAGTEVVAPMEGVVHSVADNANPLDYGPTVILEHRLSAGDGGDPAHAYTLFGHLARESLSTLRPGTAVGRGQRVGWVGDASVNGGWPPHLHFQVQLDMLGLEGDYPGVVHPDERSLWLPCVPDPSCVLGLGQTC